MIDLKDKEKLKSYLLKRSVRVGDCLRFIGSRDSSKYGFIQMNHRHLLVHRLAAYIFHGLDLDNLDMLALHKPECKFKDCWDENHVYVGNYLDNARDAVSAKTHRNSRKTHCKNGHPFTKQNTYIEPNGNRNCRVCVRMASKVNYEMKKRIKARKQT